MGRPLPPPEQGRERPKVPRGPSSREERLKTFKEVQERVKKEEPAALEAVTKASKAQNTASDKSKLYHLFLSQTLTHGQAARRG